MPHSFNRILLPIDGSYQSKVAVDMTLLISKFFDSESSLRSFMHHGSSTFKGISNVFSQMGNLTPIVFCVNYNNTYLYYNNIIKTYP